MMVVRVLILGLGSIGRRHATLLRQHFSHEVELASMRTHIGRTRTIWGSRRSPDGTRSVHRVSMLR